MSESRKGIHEYLSKDGERIPAVRQVVCRAKHNLPQIKQDIDLLEKLISTYEK
jgi:hypothetical protein